MAETLYDLGQHPTKDTIKMMTCLLEKTINAEEPKMPSTCFHARSIPSISIHAYLLRILKYCPCANECFLAVLVYFDRLSKSAITIDPYNIHRLLISGIMVASKLYSDVFFTNTRYAKVGGLPVTELNRLELEFIAMNQFSLFVSMEELQHYGNQLLLHWLEHNPYPEAIGPLTEIDLEQE
ncbi:cyclin-domain-containing protein [Blakeslea trispora]|nr:cyclin-domain-containing protein [Blakeslea trispora]